MSHSLKMLLGCLIPLSLLFVLPILGVDEGVVLFIAMALMFACHLFMMRAHIGENDD